MKGVQWSIFSEEMRSEIRNMFTEILIGGEVNEVKATYKQRLFAEFQRALERATEGDLNAIQKFAQRLRSSGKSSKCKFLQTRYPEITDDYIFTLPLKRITKQQKKGELLLPI